MSDRALLREISGRVVWPVSRMRMGRRSGSRCPVPVPTGRPGSRVFQAGRFGGLILLAVLILPDSGWATLVGAGDIAFIRFNADGLDDFAIVLLADADAGQQVSFNDNIYDERFPIFGGAEDHFVWTIDEALPAGTVVTFTNLDAPFSPAVASHGTITGKATRTMALSAFRETIYAYLGTDPRRAGTFLAAISTEDPGVLNGTGLVNGDTAVILEAQADEGHYKGPRDTESSFPDYRPLIGSTAGHWHVRQHDGVVPPFDPSNFRLAGVGTPESPRVVILGLAGLLVVLGRSTTCRRRRSAQNLA